MQDDQLLTWITFLPFLTGLVLLGTSALARTLGTPRVAHGCTAAGNDQFRFDLTIRSLGQCS